MCCSPFVDLSLAADGYSVRVFEGRASWPVGLTAREVGTAPTGLAGELFSCPSGASLIGPHERTVARTEQKLRIDKRTEQRITCSAVETPHPLRLRRRQPQSRHFAVLALNPLKYVIKRLLCWHGWLPPFLNSVFGWTATEQRRCQRCRGV